MNDITSGASASSVATHRASSAESFWVVGDRVSLRGQLAGTDLHVVDVEVPPGSGTPPHTHAYAEIFRVLQGTLRIWSLADGVPQEIDAGPGDVITIPAHAPHAYRNAGTTPAVFMAIVNGQAVRFFQAMASSEPVVGPPGPDVVGRIMALTAEHGVKMLAA
ncbi:MAG TPA: cupin domain-containing protein [Microvirga sp.]|nr:cupin domain-containing protein [Microvirga sp.]